MRNRFLASILLASFSLAGGAQVRTIPPIDLGTIIQLKEEAMSLKTERPLDEKENKQVEEFQKVLLDLTVQLKTNWKSCVSSEATIPKNLIDAYTQMDFMATPLNGKEDCDPDKKKVIRCLMSDNKMNRSIRRIGKSDLAQKLMVLDSKNQVLISLGDFMKNFKKMSK